MKQRRFIVAIDAGGSTTRCVVADSSGNILGAGRGGPANHILNGWDTASWSLRTAITEALEAAGTAADRVSVAVIGSAGIGPNGEGREVVESLLTKLVPQATLIRATGDMVAAFWGALREPVGVVVCAGTGSVCYGRNANGGTCQVGGWGPTMGDEGSAYDIATQALRAVARAADGREPPTALTARLATALGGHGPLDVALRVYSEPMNREQIAALAVHVAAAGRDGDETAIAILRRAGDELGLAVVTALRTLGLAAGSPTVSFAGSVFEAGELVYEPFSEVTLAAVPKAKLAPPLLSPVGGAVRLGLDAVGMKVDGRIFQRLRAGLLRSGW